MSIITANQQAEYRDNGFLIIPDFISSDSCDHLISHAKHLINEFNPEPIKAIFSTKDIQHAKTEYFLNSGSRVNFFFEENAFDDNGELKVDKSNSINKIGHALHELDPVFMGLCHNSKFAALSRDLQMQDPLLIQSMYICKQPFIGGEVNCHQDGTYLHSKNESITGYWLALEDATIQNGCLWAIPGGHHNPLKSIFCRNKNNEVSQTTYDAMPWSLDNLVPLEVPRGTLIVLHSRVPHMSYENKSHRSRHAFTLHVMDGRDQYLETNWLQRPGDMPFMGFR